MTVAASNKPEDQPEIKLAKLAPIAAKIDAALARLDGQINWLHELSPIHNEAMWAEFTSSNFKKLRDFSYAPSR